MTAEAAPPLDDAGALIDMAARHLGYTARHLSVLEGLEAVRKRPGMYIGSTDWRGLMHCLWEIIDNAVDEALAGYCTRIEVILHADGSVEVRDNGRGIPVDVEPKTGLAGRRGRDDRAARGRQVRRRVVRRLRRPARRRRLRGQRAVGPARRRGRPRRHDPRHQLPARRARRRSTAMARTRRSSPPPGCARPRGRQEQDRHPGPVLARPADLPARRRAVPVESCTSAPGRPPSSCPA